jgi:hypothetical protein
MRAGSFVVAAGFADQMPVARSWLMLMTWSNSPAIVKEKALLEFFQCFTQRFNGIATRRSLTSNSRIMTKAEELNQSISSFNRRSDSVRVRLPEAKLGDAERYEPVPMFYWK